MLGHAKLQSIILTSNLERAETFYRQVLGLRLERKSDGALVFDVGGGDLRVAPIESMQPGEHTALGFEVPDVGATVDSLLAAGISIERFEQFPHDEKGILTTPDNSMVAWFRDPDGNLLSVVQFDS